MSSVVLLLFACGDGTEPGGPSNVDRIVVAPEPLVESGLVVNETRQLKVFLLDTANAILPDAPTRWRSSDPAKACEPIWVAPAEYVIVRKLEYRRHGAGEHHVDDVARMLRVSRALIDQATLDGWIARVGVAQEWKEALDRLARLA